MPFVLSCPACGQRLTSRVDVTGKTTRCPKCNEKFGAESKWIDSKLRLVPQPGASTEAPPRIQSQRDTHEKPPGRATPSSLETSENGTPQNPVSQNSRREFGLLLSRVIGGAGFALPLSVITHMATYRFLGDLAILLALAVSAYVGTRIASLAIDGKSHRITLRTFVYTFLTCVLVMVASATGNAMRIMLVFIFVAMVLTLIVAVTQRRFRDGKQTE